MRVTTKMVDTSAAQTGLGIHTASLANYVKTDSDDSIAQLLESKLGNNSVKATSTYKKLEKSAEALKDAASKLSSDGTDNVYTKATADQDTSGITDTVKTLVDNYNSVLKTLKSSPSTLNNFYRTELKSAASDNISKLKNAGLTIAKDGSISIDEDKLKSADVETLQNAFGSSSDFTEKVTYIAEHVSENAAAGVKSSSTTYSADGLLSSVYNDSKFDSQG